MTTQTRFRYVIAVLICVVVISLQSSAQNDPPQSPLYQIALEDASAVAWSPDGDMLAVRDTSGIRFYTPELEFIQVFELPTEHAKVLSWSPNGDYIATVGFDENARGNTVYVWDIENRELLTVFDEHTLYVPSITWSPNGDIIATGSWDNRIVMWNPITGELLREVDITPISEDYPYPNWITFSLDWSPNGQELVSVALSVGIYIWNVQTGELIRRIVDEDVTPPTYYVAEWLATGELLATNYNVLDAQTGNVLVTFDNCPSSATIAWNPNSLLLAMYTSEGVVVCDSLNDVVVLMLEGDFGTEESTHLYLDGLAWHPNGELLAGAVGDGFVRIWQVESD